MSTVLKSSKINSISLEPSKTQRKAESSARQTLGADITKLKADQFAQLTLPEVLLDAVTDARKITSHEGKRRQLQYIGKVMRHLDEQEFADVQFQVSRVTAGHRLDTKLMHRAEAWRDALLANEQAARQELNSLPQEQREVIEEILLQAQSEAKHAHYGPYSRQVFKQIRLGLEILAQQLVEK